MANRLTRAELKRLADCIIKTEDGTLTIAKAAKICGMNKSAFCDYKNDRRHNNNLAREIHNIRWNIQEHDYSVHRPENWGIGY